MSKNAHAIIANYCENVREQLDDLLALIDIVSTRQSPDHAVILEAIGEAHRMGGAAHCMGFAHFGSALLELGQQLTISLENGEQEPIEAVWRAQHLCGLALRQCRYVRPETSSLLKSLMGETSLGVTARRDLATSQEHVEERILFAEDDPSIRELVGHILTEEGFENVAFASSGAEALAISETFLPTLILTDWSMKEMGGLELLRQIRSGAAGIASEIPVIVITTQNNLGKVRAVVREGANHFLLKPFTKDVLIGAIEKVLHRTSPEKRTDPAAAAS